MYVTAILLEIPPLFMTKKYLPFSFWYFNLFKPHCFKLDVLWLNLIAGIHSAGEVKSMKIPPFLAFYTLTNFWSAHSVVQLKMASILFSFHRWYFLNIKWKSLAIVYRNVAKKSQKKHVIAKNFLLASNSMLIWEGKIYFSVKIPQILTAFWLIGWLKLLMSFFLRYFSFKSANQWLCWQ